MTTYKKGNVTIKNFEINKGVAINYYNNICTKAYVEQCGLYYDCENNGYCVNIIYKKK